jgi:hypothetical protein
VISLAKKMTYDRQITTSKNKARTTWHIINTELLKKNKSECDAIVIDFSKAFDLVPHDRLLIKLSETGVEWRVVNWIKNFLSGHSQRE